MYLCSKTQYPLQRPLHITHTWQSLPISQMGRITSHIAHFQAPLNTICQERVMTMDSSFTFVGTLVCADTLQRINVLPMWWISPARKYMFFTCTWRWHWWLVTFVRPNLRFKKYEIFCRNFAFTISFRLYIPNRTHYMITQNRHSSFSRWLNDTEYLIGPSEGYAKIGRGIVIFCWN